MVNIQTGQWVGKQSGLGAGMDSFYEYLLKSYILFGEKEDYRMFQAAYESIQNHMRRGWVREPCTERMRHLICSSYVDELLFGANKKAMKPQMFSSISETDRTSAIAQSHAVALSSASAVADYSAGQTLRYLTERCDALWNLLRLCVFSRRESCNEGEGDPPLYVNVNMCSGEIMNTWIDSLQAFFPGLQVRLCTFSFHQ